MPRCVVLHVRFHLCAAILQKSSKCFRYTRTHTTVPYTARCSSRAFGLCFLVFFNSFRAFPLDDDAEDETSLANDRFAIISEEAFVRRSSPPPRETRYPASLVR
mmetsp:Transcript_1192/g.2826  ORF Transcript_1192/g.2826 Transcript_1192/m.2826 type:complete len:104 (-) Transcript_1192:1163-1474(-)